LRSAAYFCQLLRVLAQKSHWRAVSGPFVPVASSWMPNHAGKTASPAPPALCGSLR
jgi:hypothetical protein